MFEYTLSKLIQDPGSVQCSILTLKQSTFCFLVFLNVVLNLLICIFIYSWLSLVRNTNSKFTNRVLYDAVVLWGYSSLPRRQVDQQAQWVSPKMLCLPMTPEGRWITHWVYLTSLSLQAFLSSPHPSFFPSSTCVLLCVLIYLCLFFVSITLFFLFLLPLFAGWLRPTPP